MKGVPSKGGRTDRYVLFVVFADVVESLEEGVFPEGVPATVGDVEDNLLEGETFYGVCEVGAVLRVPR